MAELHLSIFTPHSGQVINVPERNPRCLLKDDPGLRQLTFLLIELGKAGPERVDLPNCLVHGDSLYCLRECIDDLISEERGGREGVRLNVLFQISLEAVVLCSH